MPLGALFFPGARSFAVRLSFAEWWMPPVSVVTICREPLGVTLRFLAWHRHLGADHVLLMLDDANDPVLPWVAGLDWVRPVVCDAAFWQAEQIDPAAPFPIRQVAALTYGYRQIKTGWVAVADADELFHFGGRGFHEVLDPQPDSMRALRIGTAEYVSTQEGVHFRLPMTKAQANAVYGPDAVLFRPTEGLVGHRSGKSITRAGFKIRRMRPHWAVGLGKWDLTDTKIGPDRSVALLHFVNTDFQGWRAKLEWRLSSRGISARVINAVREIMATAEDREEALAGLFDRLHRMTPEAIARLQQAGVHLTVPEDMLAITRSIFAGAPDALPARA